MRALFRHWSWLASSYLSISPPRCTDIALEDESAVPAEVHAGRGGLAGLGPAKRRADKGVDSLTGGRTSDIQR